MSHLADQEIIDSHFAKGEDLDPAVFPELATLSSAFFYDFTPVAKNPAPPELVFLPTKNVERLSDSRSLGCSPVGIIYGKPLSTAKRSS